MPVAAYKPHGAGSRGAAASNTVMIHPPIERERNKRLEEPEFVVERILEECVRGPDGRLLEIPAEGGHEVVPKVELRTGSGSERAARPRLCGGTYVVRVARAAPPFEGRAEVVSRGVRARAVEG